MPKFVKKHCNNIYGKIPFYKIIEDGECYWDEFCKQIQSEGTWVDQLLVLTSLMDDKSNLRLLPQVKYRPIDSGVSGVDGFEFKSNDLRAYCISDGGNIIIMAGKKSTQKKDIPKFRSIVKRYINSKI